jgi:serine/threonine protein phosphatase PrpC
MAKNAQPRPDPRKVSQDFERGIAHDIELVVFEEDDRIEALHAPGVREEKLAGILRLQGCKAKMPAPIAIDDKTHEAIAEIAIPVEENGRWTEIVTHREQTYPLRAGAQARQKMKGEGGPDPAIQGGRIARSRLCCDPISAMLRLFMKITSYGKTHAGCLRENNEDAFLIQADAALFAVADGLGGLPDGEEASRIAIETLAELSKREINGGVPRFESLFSQINSEVYRVGTERYNDTSIGTTLTSACIRKNRVYVGHVGDSAAFLLRKGELHALTEEHTMAALYGGSHGRRNETSLPEYYFHTLTRCVGATDSLETALGDFELLPGDRLLLCTDGLTKVLTESELGPILGEVHSAKHAVELFVETALERGGPDNIAVVVAFVEADEG